MTRIPDEEARNRARRLEALLSEKHRAEVRVGGWATDKEMRLAAEAAKEAEALFGIEVVNLNRLNAHAILERRRKYREGLRREIVRELAMKACRAAALFGVALLALCLLTPLL